MHKAALGVIGLVTTCVPWKGDAGVATTTADRPLIERRVIFAGACVAVAVVGLLLLRSQPAVRSIKVVSSSQMSQDVVLTEAEMCQGDWRVAVRALTADLDRVCIRSIDMRSFDNPQLVKAKSNDAVIGAINGGYFDDKFVPVGLMKTADGQISPLSSDKLLSAIVVCGRRRRPSIGRFDTVSVDASDDARQCGPILFGRSADGVARSKEAERSVIAFSHRRVAFITTTAASFDDVRYMLANGGVLNIPDVVEAANLDGGPSSGMIEFASPTPSGQEPRGRVTDVLVMELRP